MREILRFSSFFPRKNGASLKIRGNIMKKGLLIVVILQSLGKNNDMCIYHKKYHQSCASNKQKIYICKNKIQLYISDFVQASIVF